MPYFDLPDVPHDRVAALAELLDRQHGVVSAAQLSGMGVSSALAKARVDAGRWQRLHRGVYAAFNGRNDRQTMIWAAILRCGGKGYASHETAAELAGLCDEIDARVHVLLDANQGRLKGDLHGICVHYTNRLQRLPDSGLATSGPSVPRTGVEDTVLDLMDESGQAQGAATWITTAVQRRKTTPDQLAAALALRGQIAWRSMAEAMLHDMADGTTTMLEREYVTRVQRAHGLPSGRHQPPGYGQLSGQGRGLPGQGDSPTRYGYPEVFGTPCEVAAEQVSLSQAQGWRGEPSLCGPGCRIMRCRAISPWGRYAIGTNPTD